MLTKTSSIAFMGTSVLLGLLYIEFGMMIRHPVARTMMTCLSSNQMCISRYFGTQINDGRNTMLEANHTPTNDQPNDIMLMQNKLLMIPEYTQLPVDCAKVFAGDSNEIKKASKVTSVTRIAPEEFVTLAEDCEAFKKHRRYMTIPVSQDEELFPLAYSIQMYKDVVQMERLLRAIYRPQNIYCINVDKSSPSNVHKGMEAIARCFPNVVLTNVDVAWATYSQVQADLVCMKKTLSLSSTWKYFLTLTGQEFPLKTNLDLVVILTALNGSNAMVADTRKKFQGRWRRAGPAPINATMVKGACHFAVVRGFVEFVINTPGGRRYTQWAKRTAYPDEHVFQSLGHSPQLGIPGAYTGYPNTFVGPYKPITRYTKWHLRGNVCHGRWVHSVCVYGSADLALMSDANQLFANKFYYDLQPMTLECLEQRHYNWTRQDVVGYTTHRLNMTFYKALPNVKHHIPSGLEH